MIPTADLKNDRQIGRMTIGRGTYWANGRLVTDVFPGSDLKIGRYCSIAPDVRFVVGGGHLMTGVSTWPFDHFHRGAAQGGRTDPPHRPLKSGPTSGLAGPHTLAGVSKLATVP